MRTIQVILSLALISLALGRCQPCRRAYAECDWEFKGFEGKIPNFSVDTVPDVPFTPRIVSKNKDEVIGILNTNDVVPEFIRRRRVVPITNLGFTPTHFKPFSLPCVMGSGVGHQTFQGNQKELARGKCVRVFFTSYQQLVNGNPPQVENINVDREDFKCVVFRLH